MEENTNEQSDVTYYIEGVKTGLLVADLAWPASAPAFRNAAAAYASAKAHADRWNAAAGGAVFDVVSSETLKMREVVAKARG